MQYCRKCNVTVRGNKLYCPLCRGELTGEPENAAFPVIPETGMTRFRLWKMALFLFVSYEVVLFCLLYLYPMQWIPYAMLLGIFAICDILLILYYRRSTIKLVTYEFYVCMLLSFIVSAIAGRSGFVCAWVLPVGFTLLIPVTMLISRLNHLVLVDYMIYLLFDVFLSLTQLIFIHTQLNPFPAPAVISMGMMIIFAASLLIFHSDELRNAGSKYLHL